MFHRSFVILEIRVRNVYIIKITCLVNHIYHGLINIFIPNVALEFHICEIKLYKVIARTYSHILEVVGIISSLSLSARNFLGGLMKISKNC
jgi:hypothetical protein